MHNLKVSLSGLLLLGVGVAHAQDWSVGTGRTPERTGHTTAVGPSEPTLLWQRLSFSHQTTQIFTEGKVGVTVNSSSRGSFNTFVEAFNIETGEIMWQVRPAGNLRDPVHVSGFHGGRIYATRSRPPFELSELLCLSETDGSQLWVSTVAVGEDWLEGCTFAADGDPIVAGADWITRFNAEDGATVWHVRRSAPWWFSKEVVSDTRRGLIFAWTEVDGEPGVVALDAATGETQFDAQIPLFSTNTDPMFVETAQMGSLAMSEDGVVYATRVVGHPRYQGDLVALDTVWNGPGLGGTFTVKWRSDVGYWIFGAVGIDADGSVLVSQVGDRIDGLYWPWRLARLDSRTGEVLAHSDEYLNDVPGARMVTDGKGKVFVSNGGEDRGRIYCFDADLRERWSRNYYLQFGVSPCISANGTLLASDDFERLDAYRDQ